MRNLLVLMLVGMVAGVASAAPIFVNGDFEDGQNGWTFNSASLSTVSQWLYWDNGSTIDLQGNPTTSGSVASIATQNATIQQAVSGFEVGTEYTVEFLYNARAQFANDKPNMVFGISANTNMWGGNILHNGLVDPVDPRGTYTDTFYKASYTFTAPWETIYFTAQNTQYNNGALLLDNFTIVPEPATMSLIALGGLAMLRRRKK